MSHSFSSEPTFFYKNVCPKVTAVLAFAMFLWAGVCSANRFAGLDPFLCLEDILLRTLELGQPNSCISQPRPFPGPARPPACPPCLFPPIFLPSLLP